MPRIEPRIHIIGLGVTNPLQLSETAQQAICSSQLVMGSQRQLDLVAPLLQQMPISPQQLILPKLGELENLVQEHSSQIISVLASGDPLYYGIANWFMRQYDSSQVTTYPAVSSIQAACHALGFSLQDVQVLSLHGRPLELLRSRIKAQQTLLILTDAKSHPAALAKECIDLGLSQSVLWVCENMGTHNQRQRQYRVDELLTVSASEFSALHVTIIQPKGLAKQVTAFPGIEDCLFQTGATPGNGMITKREVRLNILSWLQPSVGDVIWDIGAGCGSVSVELAYWQNRAQIYAIEQNKQRLQLLQANRNQFGVIDNLTMVEGRAPEILSEMPRANKAFIGGSDGRLKDILLQTWRHLPENGMLVASAVTEKSRASLQQFAQSIPDAVVESVEIAVKKGRLQQSRWHHQEKLPVTLFKFSRM